MRGKEAAHDLDKARRGITPAYAGKSNGGPRLGKVTKDHPRVCGEKEINKTVVHYRVGSPPRMRGKD